MEKIFLVFLILTNCVLAKLPPAPSGFRILNTYTNAVMLKWESVPGMQDGFLLEKSTDGEKFETVKYLTGDCTSFLDIGLIKDRMYYYRLFAVNKEGKSENTKPVSAFTSPTDYCTIGTDTTRVGYPFYTYFMSARTQMLYRRSEFNAIGCNAYGILGIQFYVTTTPTGVLTNTTIKLKNVSDSILTNFIDTGFTTVYNGNINLVQNSWNSIYFANWFTIIQNKNLIIEICYTNSYYYPVNAFVRSTLYPGCVMHRHMDNSPGCTLTNPGSYEYRPNVHFITFINTVIKIRDVENPDYRLEQNYPNPFNGSTKFRFTIKKQSPVSLTLYDILGKQEVMVFNEPLGPGEYEKIFYPDKFSLPSGIYYYCLSTPEYSSVKKLVLLK